MIKSDIWRVCAHTHMSFRLCGRQLQVFPDALGGTHHRKPRTFIFSLLLGLLRQRYSSCVFRRFLLVMGPPIGRSI